MVRFFTPLLNALHLNEATNAADAPLSGFLDLTDKWSIEKLKLQLPIDPAFFPKQIGNLENDIVLESPVRRKLQAKTLQELVKVFGAFPWQNNIARIPTPKLWSVD